MTIEERINSMSKKQGFQFMFAMEKAELAGISKERFNKIWEECKWDTYKLNERCQRILNATINKLKNS